MIKIAFWKKEVLDLICHISDKSYQEVAWFGKDKKIVSSIEELYCRLYDDLLFETFLNSNEVQLNSKQKRLGKRLLMELNKFDRIFSENFINPKIVINHPLWIEIREVAKQFLFEMSYPCPSPKSSQK